MFMDPERFNRHSKYIQNVYGSRKSFFSVKFRCCYFIVMKKKTYFFFSSVQIFTATISISILKSQHNSSNLLQL